MDDERNPEEDDLAWLELADLGFGLPKSAGPDDRPPRIRLIKLAQVLDRTTPSRSVVCERVKAGEFPAPVRTGQRSVAWIEREVDDWISNRPRA